jgi:hypothetical protein
VVLQWISGQRGRPRPITKSVAPLSSWTGDYCGGVEDEDSELEVDVELLGAVVVVSDSTVVPEVLVLSFAQSRPRQSMTVPLLPLVFESELAVLEDVLSLSEVEADPELERESTSTSVF